MNGGQWACQLLLLLVALLLITVCTAYPSHSFLRNDNFIRRRSLFDCLHDEALLEKCERCAKDSHSSDALIMCCNNFTGIRGWCDKFLAFGRDEVAALQKRWTV